MLIHIFIDFIPECFIVFSVTYPAEIVRIYQFIPFALRCLRFYSFMNIHQFCNQAIVFLSIAAFNQIALPFAKLKRNMVFIRFYIQIFNFFFLFGFFGVFREFQTMQFCFYGLFAHSSLQTAFFATSPIGSLYSLFQHFCYCIFCYPFMFFQSQDPVQADTPSYRFLCS